MRSVSFPSINKWYCIILKVRKLNKTKHFKWIVILNFNLAAMHGPFQK